jgi:membrane protease YdiL (CAAX protease family)
MLWRLGLHTVLIFVLTSIFTVAIIFLVVIIDSLAGTNLSNVLAGEDPMAMLNDPWLGSVLIPGATFLGIFLATFISGRWLDRRKFIEFGFRYSKNWLRDFCFGLFLGAFLMALVFIFGWLTGNVRIEGFFQSSSENGKFLPGFLQSLVFYIFVGFYEELLSRGYHLINLAEGLNGRVIGKRWAVILALMISSIVFGLLHMNNPNATWISTLNIALAGGFLGLGMLLTGSLAIPIGLHITWNLFQGNVFGFAVSGTVRGATLIAVEPVGPVWLTGGRFGPEAGVMGLAAMVIGSILIILWVRSWGQAKLETDLAVFKPLEEDIEAE